MLITVWQAGATFLYSSSTPSPEPTPMESTSSEVPSPAAAPDGPSNTTRMHSLAQLLQGLLLTEEIHHLAGHIDPGLLPWLPSPNAPKAVVAGAFVEGI